MNNSSYERFIENLKFQGKTDAEVLRIKSEENFSNLKDEVYKELDDLVMKEDSSLLEVEFNVNEIIVPTEVRYISDLPGFQFPFGHSIINKGITGCGMTEFVLRNDENVILCSPRKILLENKVNQRLHVGDPSLESILYVNYGSDKDYEEVEKLRELERKKNRHKVNSVFDYRESKVSSKAYIESLKSSLLDSLEDIEVDGLKEDYTSLSSQVRCHIHSCFEKRIPCKILVTYDSFPKVLKILGEFNLISHFRVVVDEFQSIFMDSSFKANIEATFLDRLRTCPTVTYISATPMMEKYLSKLDSFRGLPFTRLVWDPNNVSCPLIKRIRVNSVSKSILNVISEYKSGKFPVQLDSDGSPVESKEAVFYVNSVKSIRDLIKSCNLSPSEVNILCSNSKFNRDLLSQIGHSIGSIPNLGEPHKMFTFCTRTVYLGADFYSTNASTYVVATPNIKTLMLDISLDLPQIIGRQRLDCNPFKNICTVFYESTDEKFLPSKEEFVDYISRKDKQTNSALKYMSVDSIPEDEYFDVATIIHKGLIECGDKFYLRWDVNSNSLVKNPLVRLSELRSWEVSQFEYQDKVFLFKPLSCESQLSQGDDDTDFESDKKYSKAIFIKDMILGGSVPNIPSNLKLKNQIRLYSYCMVMSDPTLPKYLKSKVSSMIPLDFDTYYSLLGPSKCLEICSRKDFDLELLRDEVKLTFLTKEARDFLISKFTIGSKLSIDVIKSFAREFSNILGLSKYKFKYSDFSRYVEYTRTTQYIPGTKISESCLHIKRTLFN